MHSSINKLIDTELKHVKHARLMKESLGLEKKIKTSKALGLEKEDNNFKGPCWATWLRGWQNWTLSPTRILRADASAWDPPPLSPGTPQACSSALLTSSPIASTKPPLKYESSLILRALSLVVRPTVTPPCLNKGKLSRLRSSFFLHCLVSNYTLQSKHVKHLEECLAHGKCSKNVSNSWQ